jgi:phage I-like protein
MKNLLLKSGFAACTQALGADPSEIQLLPAQPFRAVDGRPTDAPAWVISGVIAARLIQQAVARANSYVIDYEHQTLWSENNGQPAPASGWFKNLVWREGKGLFAVDVEWTATARKYIADKAYRYVSPVFSYQPGTGEILTILHVALTNNPAIDGMSAVGEMAAARWQASDVAPERLLSPVELAVCRQTGTDPAQYLKTKARLAGQQGAASSGVERLLSPVELAVCRQMGTDPAQYLEAKARLAGQQGAAN